MRTLFFCFGLFVVFSSNASVSSEEVDTNEDGMVEAREFMHFLRIEKGKSLWYFDRNYDGKIEGQERKDLDEYLEGLDNELEPHYLLFTKSFPGGQKLSDFAKRNSLSDSESFEKRITFGKFLLRDSVEIVALDKESTPAKKAKGASLEFQRDIEAGESTWTAKGAILRPYFIGEDPKNAITPSLSFNRVKNRKDKTDDVDTLNFKVAYEHLISSTNPTYYRAIPTYGTDSNFDSKVPGLELQIEPTLLDWGMGSFRRKGAVAYRWRGILQYEHGEVQDAGENANLTQGDEFARLGTKLFLDLSFPSLERLGISMEYLYLAKISANQRDRKLFKSTFLYNLDVTGNLAVKAEYLNGDSSSGLEDEDLLTLGLGLKF